MKTAIVVSGGDAPGINAAIEAYARLARRGGGEVLGASGGFAGLLAGSVAPLDAAALSRMAGLGGSILPSSREPVLAHAGARGRLGAIMREHAIDNLLVFGGDGTLRHVAPLLDDWGVAFIALPATIDNDAAGTGYTLGHDSACNYALAAVDGIRATALALPGRVFLLETLGAPSGHLALAVAKASGAHAVLLPEYAFERGWLRERLAGAAAREGYAFALLSEALADIDGLVNDIARPTGLRVRLTRLGHAQRGAAASHRDRLAAREMSRLAYRALEQGVASGMTAWRAGAWTLQPIPPRDAMKPPPDYAAYAHINGL